MGNVLAFPLHRCTNAAPPGDVSWVVIRAQRAIQARMKLLGEASAKRPLSSEEKEYFRQLSSHRDALRNKGAGALVGRR